MSPYFLLMYYSFPRRQSLDSSKLNEFADDNFKFDENGRKFSEQTENTSDFSFSHSVFNRLTCLQTHVKRMVCFGKG